MSISNIRQRKLFKSKEHNLTRLLTDKSNSQDEKQQHFYFRTQISENRESYSSRPTLQNHQQPNGILRQLTFLQNRINKQQQITHKYFQQLQCLENQYNLLAEKQNYKYQRKIQQVKQRIERQKIRNNKAQIRKENAIQNLVNKLVRAQPMQSEQKNYVTTKRQNTQNNGKKHFINKEIIPVKTKQSNQSAARPREQDIASEFLQMVRGEIMHRRIKALTTNTNGVNSKQHRMITNKPEQTFDFALCPTQQERDSESILLDDSLIV